MNLNLLKERVKNAKVEFVKYFDSSLWYKTEDGFEFPVPVSDVGTATFLRTDNAMLFMCYIRKHMELIEVAKNEQESLG